MVRHLPETLPEDMVKGKLYKIVHKSETQRYWRFSVLRFMDRTERGDLIFSARPKFGTTEIPLNWVRDIILFPDDAPIMVNERLP